MQHMLSVTGNLCADKLPFVSGVQVSGARDNLVFQADSAENMQRLKRSLALSLANTIIEEYEGRYLEAYINKAYQNLDTMERQKVFCAAAEEMERTSPKQRAHYIENRLYAFLDKSDVLSIDGFVAFRLKDYKTLLERTAARAANAYEMEKEYAEFIALLQYFISLQPVGTSLLHVVFTEDGTCQFYNADGENIVFGDTGAIGEEPLSTEEILLSALISIAPKEILLHHAAGHMQWEIMETVQKLFAGHVHLCENCQICTEGAEK